MGAGASAGWSRDYRDAATYPTSCEDVPTVAAASAELEAALAELPALLGDVFEQSLPSDLPSGRELRKLDLERARGYLGLIRELVRSFDTGVVVVRYSGRDYTVAVDAATTTFASLRDDFQTAHLDAIAEAAGTSRNNLHYEIAGLRLWYTGAKHTGVIEDEAARLIDLQVRKEELIELRYAIAHATDESQHAEVAKGTVVWNAIGDNGLHGGGGSEREANGKPKTQGHKADRAAARENVDRLNQQMKERRKSVPRAGGAALPAVTPQLLAFLKMAFGEYDGDGNGTLDWSEFWYLVSCLLNVTDDEIGALWGAADRNGDGVVSLSELIPSVGPSLMRVYGTKPPCANDWVVLQSDEGYPYHYNKRTGASQWIAPDV